MFPVETLDELYAHMEWADARVWQAVMTLKESPVDERIRGRLLHLHVVQRAFLHVWTDKPLVFPKPDEFPDLISLQKWIRPYYGEVRQFLGTLDTARLGEPLSLPWLKQFEERLGRGLETPTLAETCFQVTSHSTYHRGQVNTRLRELGAEPPLVDYIAWVWFGRPAALWTPDPEGRGMLA